MKRRVIASLIALLWALWAVLGYHLTAGVVEQHAPGYPSVGQWRYYVYFPVAMLVIKPGITCGRNKAASAAVRHRYCIADDRVHPVLPWLHGRDVADGAIAAMCDARTVTLRRWLSEHCTMLRTDRRVADVELCCDVAEALKHAILTRNLDVRQIRENDAVLALSTGYGELGFGEAKYGGKQQVIVLTNAGRRALSSVLQNVIDAWRRAAGLELPAVGVT